jgi:hypothetical protein
MLEGLMLGVAVLVLVLEVPVGREGMEVPVVTGSVEAAGFLFLGGIVGDEREM